MPDIGLWSAIVNMIASLGVVYIMMTVTREAGWRSVLQVVKGCHRVALATLAVVLFANAATTLYDDTDPRPVDFVMQVVLLMVIGVSAIRHRMVPRQRSSRR